MSLCDHCDLAFHRAPDQGSEGCGCNRYGCGCRIKRERTHVVGDPGEPQFENGWVNAA